MHAVVICTRNRDRDLKRALRSLANSEFLPGLTLVVDSSTTRATQDLVAAEARTWPESRELLYLEASPGLTHQRNVALRELLAREADTVHFLDDDVEVDRHYFQHLVEALSKRDSYGREAVGAGGLVWSGTGHRKVSLLGRLFGYDADRPGAVLKSGFNIGCFPDTPACEVDWLAGCSMSFRLQAIRKLAFDERRTGYALGEDVDFGLKASGLGPVWFVPAATLVHHQSPVNREKLPALARMGVLNRAQLARDFPNRVAPRAVFIANIGQVVKFYLHGVTRLNLTSLRCGTEIVKAMFGRR